MKRSQLIVAATALLLAAVLLVACATVPITGRKQLSLISDGEMHAMSYQQYEQVIAESRLSSDAEATAMIKRVGGRIQAAVEKYFREHGMSGELEGYAWEFNLIESDEVNAWCMPGGKVAFYTGILPVCQDDVGVAVVMGHEIAHAIAEHGDGRATGRHGPVRSRKNQTRRNKGHIHVGLCRWHPLRRDAALQPQTRKRSRSHRPDLHGDGRLRSPRKSLPSSCPLTPPTQPASNS